MGPHTRNPRLVFARCRALPRRETETGAEKVEAPLNRPRVTTNRGADSVSWRGQLWRSIKLGFLADDVQLVRPRLASFFNQKQHLGQAGADLCTGCLGTSTSGDQLRNRLKELTRRISGIGALSVG